MKHFRNIFFALVAGLLITTPVLAATIKEGDNISQTESIADDLYAFANTVSLQSEVTGDVFAFGNSIEIRESVAQDVYTAGQSVSVTGAIGDDLHAAGNTITITSDVTGDAFAGGQSITVTEDATIGKDLYVGGATITIAGEVNGDVRAGGNVVITDTARINGNVYVSNQNPPTVEEGARIIGEVTHRQPERTTPAQPTFQDQLSTWLRQIASLFVISLLLLLIFPHITQRLITSFTSSPGKNLGFGLLWVLLFVPVVILLLITIIGIPIALLVIAATVLAFILASAISALFLGTWLMSKLTPEASMTNITWTHALLGATAYHTIQLVPVVGWIATFVLVLISLGALVSTLTPHKTKTVTPVA